MTIPPAALVVVAYLLGSISFAVLIVRATTGKDIRAEGSGNAGATNVLRAHGRKLALLVALLDVAKGAGAVLLMRLVTADPVWTAAAGVAAVLGHVFPVFYGFRGGKGVATAVGAFLVLAPLALLCCLAVFVLVVALTRYVSLGSVIAMVLLPPVAGLLFRAPRSIVMAASLTALVVVFKHLGNLKRLALGQERKLGAK
ncbi:MAG TPA: glycerol-3-phosphate 1-O-acyltransferase PlsY [Thermoanaerobaculia bacterium]|nr:glycerol-3-phosphate 1-O-acyltransferase PlsY [Thermoanaerobaculia bacterium]HEV8610949.1 glycerol-3-phosphate 1-O-acyltransferase PlsY [Thermoanaerobaculia bacterium]